MSFVHNFKQMFSNKLLEAQEIMPVMYLLKQDNQKIIFTNGCFDILHKGHVTYLEEAKNQGGMLIVGINSDASVRALGKAANRPINTEMDRALVVAGLASVDYVFIFEEETPERMIQMISPDVLVKGGDYDANETDKNSKKYIVGSAWVKEHGGVVMSIPLVEEYSTTRIIDEISNKKNT